jgi:hypothetical protein
MGRLGLDGSTSSNAGLNKVGALPRLGWYALNASDASSRALRLAAILRKLARSEGARGFVEMMYTAMAFPQKVQLSGTVWQRTGRTSLDRMLLGKSGQRDGSTGVPCTVPERIVMT